MVPSSRCPSSRRRSCWIRCTYPLHVIDWELNHEKELQRIVSRSLDLLYSGTATPSGLQTSCDYLQIIRAIESQIETWQNQWNPLIQKADAHTPYRLAIAKFYYHYAMLVLNSFGLQNAFERSPVDVGYFFGRCYTSASACCEVMKNDVAPAGFLRYAPDSHFVLTSYAVLSLLKVCVRLFFSMNGFSLLNSSFDPSSVATWTTTTRS